MTRQELVSDYANLKIMLRREKATGETGYGIYC
jgi:hypothetical protein